MAQGAKIRLGHEGKAIHRADGKIVDDDDVIYALVLMRKGADSGPTLDGLHAKVERAQRAHPAAGREGRADDRPRRPARITRWARCCTTWARG